MSAATNEREIAESIVSWLSGKRTKGTAGVLGTPPRCFVCGSQPVYEATDGAHALVVQIEEIIQEGYNADERRRG